MIRALAAIVLVAVALLASAWVNPNVSGFFQPSGGGGGGDTAFTALHTYYLSPTGSDAANGLTPGTAWATPNHALNCGDVIVAAQGAYNTSWSSWGTVSNCPSTSGGIDGAGGIYFAILLCGGTGLGASDGCTKTTSSGNAMNIAKSNWAVEGWTVTTGATARSYEVYACAAVVHHNAFINDISYNALQGFDGDDCGVAGGINTVGSDYFAVIGSIAQNSAQDPICLAAIDAVGPGQFDANAGTHIYFYGDFSYAQTNASCTSKFDTGDFMADTWDTHAVVYTGVYANNVGWQAARYCMDAIWGNHNTPTTQPSLFFYNNTCFSNDVNTGTDNFDGEFLITTQGVAGLPWNISITNNIAYQPNATSAGGKNIGAFVLGNTLSAAAQATWVNSGNVYRANQSSCSGGATCNSTFDAQSWGGSIGLGSGNTYANPSFANTADLLANWLGAPNCTGFENVTQCMGYNAYTSTLTALTPIADLTPTATYASKGYQLPSTACNTNADFPTWLKGVVYLHWTGSAIVQRHGLVTTPCGM